MGWCQILWNCVVLDLIIKDILFRMIKQQYRINNHKTSTKPKCMYMSGVMVDYFNPHNKLKIKCVEVLSLFILHQCLMNLLVILVPKTFRIIGVDMWAKELIVCTLYYMLGKCGVYVYIRSNYKPIRHKCGG